MMSHVRTSSINNATYPKPDLPSLGAVSPYPRSMENPRSLSGFADRLLKEEIS